MSSTLATTKDPIAVIGLGYVGLPLAIHLAKKFDVIGFDISAERVKELKGGFDRTDEVEDADLKNSALRYSCDTGDIKDARIYIVTVPTPVHDNNEPDLGPVLGASRMLAEVIKKGDIVVYESTVYPGVTDEQCGPVLEEISGLECGVDFFLGYSPERINPGDRVHTVDKITKVVAGQTDEVRDILCDMYGAITSGGTFPASSIRVAEAAKVIENAQRDVNIAFVNEIAMIFQKLGISTSDVLDAAGTKWNFLNFTPGLVGGHCIGVDPFYLAARAMQVDQVPDLILASRKINDNMSGFIAERIAGQLIGGGRILMLGLTFKENCPDLRNSKVVDMIASLKRRGFTLDVVDPAADPHEAKAEYGINIFSSLEDVAKKAPYVAVVGAVAHTEFVEMGTADFDKLLKPGGLIADIKAMWKGNGISEHYRHWVL